MEEKIPHISIGQKFRHKRKGTIYILRDVSDGDVILVSEDGETVMRIQLESLVSAGFESVYD